MGLVGRHSAAAASSALPLLGGLHGIAGWRRQAAGAQRISELACVLLQAQERHLLRHKRPRLLRRRRLLWRRPPLLLLLEVQLLQLPQLLHRRR